MHSPPPALLRALYTFLMFCVDKSDLLQRERGGGGLCSLVFTHLTCSRTVPPGIVSCKQYFGAFSQDSG